MARSFYEDVGDLDSIRRWNDEIKKANTNIRTA